MWEKVCCLSLRENCVLSLKTSESIFFSNREKQKKTFPLQNEIPITKKHQDMGFLAPLPLLSNQMPLKTRKLQTPCQIQVVKIYFQIKLSYKLNVIEKEEY